MNYIEDLGNYTMMGTGLTNLEHFKLNENRLVLCDKFFDGILKMENLKVLDIKDSIMPCICSLNNITNLSNIGMVLDMGANCLKENEKQTSTAIGMVNFDPFYRYTFMRKFNPGDIRSVCSKKVYGKSKRLICEDGMPKEAYKLEDLSEARQGMVIPFPLHLKSEMKFTFNQNT